MPRIWHSWITIAACALLLRGSTLLAAPAVSIDAALDESHAVKLHVAAPQATGLAVVPLGMAWTACEGPRVIEPEALSTDPVTIPLPMGCASHWLVLVHDATGATARALLDATALTVDAPSLGLAADPERPHQAIGIVRTARGTAVGAQRVVALPADALPYEDRAGQLACPACAAWLGASFAQVVASGAVAATTSGADGRFALELLPGTWILGACDPGGTCSDPVSVTIGSDDPAPTSLDLVASRRRGVAIIVEDDLGKPLAGAQVEIRPKADPSKALATGTTDASGRWLATDLPMREMIVRTRAPHHASDEIIAAGEMPLRVALLRCGSASGRVVDSAGAARAGVRVEGLHVIPPSERMTPPKVEPTESFAVTDEAGSWHLDDIPTGRILLRASSPLDLPAVSDPVDVRAGDSFVVPDLLLRPGSFVTGTVVDSVSQEGIAGARVSVVGLDAPSCATDGEGNFRLGPLDPGAMRIVAREAAHPPTPDDEKEVVVAAAGEDDVVVKLTLRPAATLEARLVTAGGEAVPDVRLQVTAGPAKRQPPTRTGVTDDEGAASFDDLPAGPARVGDLANEVEDWVTLVAGHLTRMTLVQRGTRIHGRILRDGQPAEAVISLHDVDVFGPRARAFMSPATTYTLTGAMPPSARLTIMIPSPPVVDQETHWYLEEESVPIAEGNLDVEHDIVLHAASAESDETPDGIWLTGRVVDAATDEPLATIRVTGGGHTAGMTDARGRFVTGVVGDGDYTLEARADMLRQAEMAGILESESVAVHVESGRVVSPPSIVIHVKRGPAATLRVMGASGPAAGACAWRIDRPLVVGGGSTGWADASGLVSLHANEGGAQPVIIIAPDGTVAVFDVMFGSADEQILRLPRTGTVRVTLPADGIASIKQSSWPRAITMYELDFGCRGCAWRDVEWGDGFRRIELRALPIGQVELSTRSVTRTVIVREDAPVDVDLR